MLLFFNLSGLPILIDRVTYGVVPDSSMSLTFVRVRMQAGTCLKVTGKLRLIGGFSPSAPVSSTTDLSCLFYPRSVRTSDEIPNSLPLY